MSGLPAEIHELEDRGLLLEGYWADVVVFDPETVRDRGTFDEPEQYPIGIDHVLVNGVLVIHDGEHTGAKPGKPIFGKGRAAKTAS